MSSPNRFHHPPDPKDEESLYRNIQEYFSPQARVFVNGKGVKPLCFALDRRQTHHARKFHECHGLDGLNQTLFCTMHVKFGLGQEVKLFAFVYFVEYGLHIEKIIIAAMQDILTNTEVSSYFYN